MIKKYCLSIIAGIAITSSALADSTSKGVISTKSVFSVSKTADRFEAILKDKGLSVFTRIDHSKNAAHANLKLRPTELIIFGNPKVGTKLMQCAQQSAIDLPQKALFWQDDEGKVWLSYNDPVYMQKRHHLKGCDAVIEKVSQLLNKLSIKATTK